MVADLIVGAFAYYLPAYFAEASFQFVWGCLSREDIPVAARRLGPHRTFGGMFLAICCGGSVGFLVSSFTLGVFLGLGTWFGALGGSLIKRLLGIKRGDPAGEFASDKIASLCLKAEMEDASGQYAFESKEWWGTSLRPYLEIYTTKKED